MSGDDTSGGGSDSGGLCQMGSHDNVVLNPPPGPPTNTALGARQRLRIFVPTATTEMSLGDQDSRYAQYGGFGLHTEGHSLMSAAGSAANSCMTLQSSQNLVMQSTEGSLYLGAKGNTFLVSGSNTLIGGKGGLLVHGGGGTGAGVPKLDSRSGSAPSPADYGDAAASYGKVKTFWTAAGAALTGFRLGADAVKSKLHTDAETIGGRLGTPAALAAVTKGVGLTGAGLGLTQQPPGSTLIHGDSGAILGSPMFASVYGGVGAVTVASPVGVFVAAKAVEFCGRKMAKVTSKVSVAIDAKNKTEVLAKDTLWVASRTSNCALDGKNVSVGGKGSAGAQVQTSSVAIAANETVNLQGDDVTLSGDKLTAIGGKEISLGGKEYVNIASNGEIAFNVGGAHIVAKSGEVLVGMGGSVGAPPQRASYPGSKDGYPAAAKGKESSHAGAISGHIGECTGADVSKTFMKITSSVVELDIRGCKVKGSSMGWDLPNVTVL